MADFGDHRRLLRMPDAQDHHIAVRFGAVQWRVGRETIDVLALLGRLVDAVLIALCGYLSSLFVVKGGAGFWPDYGGTVLTATVFLPFVFEKAQCYENDRLNDYWHMARTCLFGCALLFGIMLAVDFATGSLHDLSRAWCLFWIESSVASMLLSRAVLTYAIAAILRRGHLYEQVAVVGAGTLALRLVDYANRQQERPVRILGLYDDRMSRVGTAGGRPVGTIDDLVELGKYERIDRIIIALPWSAEQRLLEVVRRLKHLAVDITLAPDHAGFTFMNRRVSHLGQLPLLRVAAPPLRSWKLVLKGAEDRALSFLFLFLLSPILLLIALAVRLDSPGPALFRQKRLGFNNRPIEVLKFRSMRDDLADGSGGRQASREDARVTRLGKFLRRTSLDELPQLINVLRGEMSIVGPRPHPLGMRTQNRLCEEIVDVYAHRHRVKPGITGWAQVNGWRGATETDEELEQRVEYDLYYIDHWSIFFDLKIIAMTVATVLSRRNAF